MHSRVGQGRGSGAKASTGLRQAAKESCPRPQVAESVGRCFVVSSCFMIKVF